jgi:hypothetical protein
VVAVGERGSRSGQRRQAPVVLAVDQLGYCGRAGRSLVSDVGAPGEHGGFGEIGQDRRGVGQRTGIELGGRGRLEGGDRPGGVALGEGEAAGGPGVVVAQVPDPPPAELLTAQGQVATGGPEIAELRRGQHHQCQRPGPQHRAQEGGHPGAIVGHPRHLPRLPGQRHAELGHKRVGEPMGNRLGLVYQATGLLESALQDQHPGQDGQTEAAPGRVLFGLGERDAAAQRRLRLREAAAHIEGGAKRAKGQQDGILVTGRLGGASTRRVVDSWSA